MQIIPNANIEMLHVKSINKLLIQIWTLILSVNKFKMSNVHLVQENMTKKSLLVCLHLNATFKVLNLKKVRKKLLN